MIAHSMMAPATSLNTLFDPAPQALLPLPGTDSAFIAGSVFANYLPPSAGRPSMGHVFAPRVQAAARSRRQSEEFSAVCPTSRFSPGARKAALQAMPDYLNGTAILRNVIKQWEEKGTDRETIDAVRNGVPLEPRGKDAPGIIALGEALKDSGEYERLATQAINVYRTTCAWKETLAGLKAERPRATRQEIEQGMVDAMFRLDDRDYRHIAVVLNRLFHPETLIDLDSGTAPGQASMVAPRAPAHPVFA
jgi:hypothetical protein